MILIDSDCILTLSFEHLIDFNSDIVVCARDREGFSIHIGFFFGAINVQKSKKFLMKWINNFDLLQETMAIVVTSRPVVVIIDDDSFPIPGFVEAHKSSVTLGAL